jgi:hypothetical protein
MRRFSPVHLVLILVSSALVSLALPAIAAAAPPANDDLANATVIDPAALPFNDSVDNTQATVQPGEPAECIVPPIEKTAWYSFTPETSGLYQADTSGSNFSSFLEVFASSGPGFGGLSGLVCESFGNPAIFTAQAGTTYYFQAAAYPFAGGGELHFRLEQIPPPPNDNFGSATVIDPSMLPFSDSQSGRTATLESGEPVASCNVFGAPGNSWWYSFTPAATESYRISTFSGGLPTVAVYTGESVEALSEQACRSLGGTSTFSFAATRGVTYFIQLGDYYSGAFGGVNFSIDAAPDPVAEFFYSPGDPSPYEAVQFFNNSFDPGGSGFASQVWDFGDGTTLVNPGQFPTHQFPADSDYTVELAVTTTDGRHASVSKTIQVRTHDVAIKSFTVPKAAQAGQTRAVSVGIVNTRYPEPVQVQLFKSVPGGFQQIGSLTQDVPVRGANRTTTFGFTYTFTAADAAVGKVTFKAVAVLTGARDALPADNEAVGSPTKVT